MAKLKPVESRESQKAEEVERHQGHGLWQTPGTERPRTQGEFSQELIHLLDMEPIEDGCSHPGEMLINRTLAKQGTASAQWIQAIYHENLNRRPSIAAGILRCLGRLSRNVTHPWGVSLAISGLSNSDIEIRDAAVRALETWGGPESLEALERHLGNESVAWLADYTRRVIADLPR